MTQDPKLTITIVIITIFIVVIAFARWNRSDRWSDEDKIEAERERTAKARIEEVRVRQEYDKMMHRIKEFMNASNQLYLIQPLKDKPSS